MKLKNKNIHEIKTVALTAGLDCREEELLCAFLLQQVLGVF